MRSYPQLFLLSAIMLLAVSLSSCMKDRTKTTKVYKVNQPIYLSKEELKANVFWAPAQTLHNPGKFYSYGNLLLINERGHGVHVIDNANPSAPNNLGFIKIPGNQDIAVKDGMLYADSYRDLLVLEVGSSSAEIVERIESVFDYDYFSWDFDSRYPLAQIDHSKGVVIGWTVEEITEICEDGDCDDQLPEGFGWGGQGGVVLDNAVGSPGPFNYSGGQTVTGVGGSLAKFMVNNSYLYVISSSSAMKVFDIQNTSMPDFQTRVEIGWNIETLFSTGTHMFIGAQTGMYIYDLSSPTDPSFVSTFMHFKACDPVVVHGNYAYVTLRGGGRLCGESESQLNVVDISDLSNPWLVQAYDMEGPYGVGIDGQKEAVFVCDGDAGLKIYGSQDPRKIDENHLVTYSELNAFDVIPLNGNLLMIGEDGFVQYDYSDLNNIHEISRIPVMPN